jgi:hypothetical protein
MRESQAVSQPSKRGRIESSQAAQEPDPDRALVGVRRIYRDANAQPRSEGHLVDLPPLKGRMIFERCETNF